MKRSKETSILTSLAKTLNVFVTSTALIYSAGPSIALGEELDLANTVMRGLQKVNQVGQQRNQMMLNNQMGAVDKAKAFQFIGRTTAMLPPNPPPRATLFGANNPEFNKCTVPPLKIEVPGGICSSPLLSPNDRKSIIEKASQLDSYYNEFLHPSSTNITQGKQCLENGISNTAKKQRSLLTKMLNNLFSPASCMNVAGIGVNQQTGQAEVQTNQLCNRSFEKVFTDFVDQQELLKREIKDENTFLAGGSLNDVEKAKTEFEKNVGKDCADVMGKDIRPSEGRFPGLLGISDQFTKKDFETIKFHQNERALKRDLQNDLAKVYEEIGKYGFVKGLANAGTKKFKFDGIIKGLINDQNEVIGVEMNRIKEITQSAGVLSKIGVNISAGTQMINNGDSVRALNQFMTNNSEEKIKDKFVLACITGKVQASSYEPLSSVVGSLYSTQSNTGNKVKRTKDRKGDIGSMTDLGQLETFVNSYNEDHIRFKRLNERGAQENVTLKKHYVDAKTQCSQIFEGKVNPVGNSSEVQQIRNTAKDLNKAMSNIAKKIEKVEKDVMGMRLSNLSSSNTLASIQRKISKTDLYKEAMVAFNSCSNEVHTADKCSNKDTFNPAAGSFCMSRAKTCATTINVCKQKIEKYTAAKKKVFKDKVTKYNKNVEEFEGLVNTKVTQLNNKLEQLAINVTQSFNNQDTDLDAQTRPDLVTGYNKPSKVGQIAGKLKDIGLKMNQLLRGGNSLAYIKSQFKKEINNITKTFGNHLKVEANAASKKVDQLTNKWTAQRELLKGFIGECMDAKAQIDQQIAKAKSDMQRDEMKRRQYCSRFSQLAQQNPGPGCGERIQSLSDEGMEISALLQQRNPDVFPAINAYSNICSTIQAEEREDDADLSSGALENLCFQQGDDFKVAMKDDLMDQIPQGFDKDEVEEYLDKLLRGENPPRLDVGDELKGHVFLKKLNRFKSLTRSLKAYDKEQNTKSLKKSFIASTGLNEKAAENYINSLGDIGKELDNQGICQRISNNGQNYKIASNCINYATDTSTASGSTTYSLNTGKVRKCVEDEVERLNEKGPTDYLGLRRIENEVERFSVGTAATAWARVGEQTGYTSCSGITDSLLAKQQMRQGSAADYAGGDFMNIMK